MVADRVAVTGSPETVRLVVGRIAKAHGIHGDVGVDVRTDDPELRFAPGSRLDADPPERGPLTVVTARWHSGRLLTRFEGVEDRSAAEALRGTLLVVNVDVMQRPADPDEYYDHHLIGLRVETTEGAAVGTVADVLHLPAQQLLAITRSDGIEVLVPFVAELVPSVDLDAGLLVVEARPGLLDPEAADGAKQDVGPKHDVGAEQA